MAATAPTGVEIVAPPPQEWPDRITVTHVPASSAFLLCRDGLVAGSVRFSDRESALAGIITALAVLGYSVETSDGPESEFRHREQW